MSAGDVETIHHAHDWSVRIQCDEDHLVANFETKEAAIEAGRRLAAARGVKHITKDPWPHRP